MHGLGIDVGSVSTDLVVIDENGRITDQVYIKTEGNPIGAVKEGLSILAHKYCDDEIYAVGTTGSGRDLAAAIVGADIVKNEITSHGVAAALIKPDVKTVIEIGGQDSKIILLRNGRVTDFAMNTVCAAGTGSFLDRQAERLGLHVEELGDYAARSTNPVRIAGRCAVFAESDLIHKQQLGISKEDIIAGMCEALVRNYLSNVAKGKRIEAPVLFQGGVSANSGIRRALERALNIPVEVPRYNKVMGAYGIAAMAVDKVRKSRDKKTGFRGFGASEPEYSTTSFCCNGCENNCEVAVVKDGDMQIAAFSDRCGKYQKLQRT